MGEDRLSVGPVAERKKMGTGTKLLLGCGITVAVVFLLLLGAAVLFGRRIIEYAMLKGVDAVIAQSTLTQEEKADAKATLREFMEGAQEGRIPKEDVQALFQEVVTSGQVGQFARVGAVNTAIERSNLDADAKKEATTDVARFAAGMVEGLLTEEEVQSVLDSLPTDANGFPKTAPWSDAELQETLALVRATIEGKALPDQPQRMPDMADDIRAVIKRMKEALRKAEEGGDP